MLRRVLLSLAFAPLLTATSACDAPPKSRGKADSALFAPTGMRIHPIFTQPKAWTDASTKAGRFDGIEALIELTDPLGDPTKAGGTVIFELYEYRRHFPDPRGLRLAPPFVFDLRTMARQREHWRRIGSAYSFQIPFPIRPGANYVLTAQFQLAGDTPTEPEKDGRFFNQIVVEVPRPTRTPTTAPAT